MNTERFPQLMTESIERLPDQLKTLSRMEAEKAIETQLNSMKQDGRIMLMTDEEERLVKAFRRFKMNVRRNGEVFKWQTTRIESPGVVVAEDTGLIRDPQEVA